VTSMTDEALTLLYVGVEPPNAHLECAQEVFEVGQGYVGGAVATVQPVAV